MINSIDTQGHSSRVRSYLLWAPAVLLLLMTAIHTILATPAHASDATTAAAVQVPSYVDSDYSSMPLIIAFIAMAAVISLLSRRSED